MPCYHPQPAYLINGQVTTVSQDNNAQADLMLPCGLCNGCRLSYAQEYGIRMIHELQETPEEKGMFLTLTYKKETIPPGHNLKYEDMKAFIKRLVEYVRYWCKKNNKEYTPIRYFYVGEYGGQSSRPHYHMILYGLDLLELDEHDSFDHGKSKSGHPQWRSHILEKQWRNGRVTVGAVTLESCIYTASYMFKDKSSDYSKKKLKTYYNVNPYTGESQKKVKPRVFASNRPGIGKAWIEKYYKETFEHGFIIHDNKKFKPPRYYREYCKNKDPQLYERYKLKIAQTFETEDAKYNQTKERLAVREKCLDLKLNKNRLPGDSYKDTGEADTYEIDYLDELEIVQIIDKMEEDDVQ